MHFEAAVDLARIVEDFDDAVVVAGFRRTDDGNLDSWALDVVNVSNGAMVTIDEKDDLTVALRPVLPR
ncbi:MAG TPA: hypothetical protein VH951_10475 [Dehalococcoidia bacterium]|jgi:hypothetical protein